MAETCVVGVVSCEDGGGIALMPDKAPFGLACRGLAPTFAGGAHG
jgi:hypothetical protein